MEGCESAVEGLEELAWHGECVACVTVVCYDSFVSSLMYIHSLRSAGDGGAGDHHRLLTIQF